MFTKSWGSLAAVTMGLAFALSTVVSAAEGDKPAAGAEQKEVKAQTMCPVMGKPINKDIYVDHDGKRVYFCCKDCVKAFNKDPEKYIKKLEDEGVTLEKVPAKDDAKAETKSCQDGAACGTGDKTAKDANAGNAAGGCCK